MIVLVDLHMPLSLAAALLLLPWPRSARAQAAAEEPGLTVAAYVSRALEAAPEVRSAAEAFASADAVYKARLAAMTLPSLSFTGTAYPYGHNPTNSYRFQRWRLNRDEVSFDTTLNWNLFNSFQDLTRARSAGLARASAQQTLSAARQDRAFAAIQAFYNYNSRSELLEVARQNLKAQDEQYRQTNDLYRNGMKSLADLLKSETDWRSSQLRLTSAEAEEKRARLEFNSLLDRPGLDEARLVVDTTTAAIIVPLVDQDLARSLAQRPEIIGARKELERASAALTQAVQDFLPKFSVDATWNRTDPASFGGPAPSIGRPNPNHYVGLSLTLPVGFNVATQAYGIAAAKAEKKRAEAAAAATVRVVRQEVHGAFISVERAMKAHSIAEQKVEIARRSLELVGAQYRQGSADAIRMNQAQTDFLNARVERALALHDMFIDRARYARAVGDPLW